MERDEILAKLRERIVAFAASHISKDVAEDLAQEVMILLHEKYRHLESLDDLLPLSLKIVRFKITGLRRKSMRRGEYSQISVADVQIPDPEPGPGAYMERKELLERLMKAVGQLGERCRELLRWKLVGMDFAEIQKRTGAASVNTVYTWDHRCRKRLLELLGGDWEGRK